MDAQPGQLDPHPAAPEPVILEYRRPLGKQVDAGPSGYLHVAKVIVYLASIALIALGAISTCFLAMCGPTRGDKWIIEGALPFLFGVALFAWEHEAVNRRSFACAVTVGCAATLASVPLCLLSAAMIRNSTIAWIIPVTLAAVAIFCAVAHFLWAARIHQSTSRPPRV